MGVSMEIMRRKVSTAYGDNWRWENRVAAMPDRQVAAIYNNMLARGIFDKRRKKKNNNEEFHQMSIFEFGVERV